jgi:hypothetical protein
MQRAFSNLPIIVGIEPEMCKRFPLRSGWKSGPAVFGTSPGQKWHSAGARFCHIDSDPGPARRDLDPELIQVS